MFWGFCWYEVSGIAPVKIHFQLVGLPEEKSVKLIHLPPSSQKAVSEAVNLPEGAVLHSRNEKSSKAKSFPLKKKASLMIDKVADVLLPEFQVMQSCTHWQACCGA